MQSIIEKYEAILKKPQPEPFKGYIEELLAALKGNETTVAILNKPKKRQEIHGVKADWSKNKGILENVTSGGDNATVTVKY